MRPINEIPPAIQGRYRELQHDLLTKIGALPPNIHMSDPKIVKMLTNTMTEMSMHFQKSIILLLKNIDNKSTIKNNIDIAQEIQDHFSIWSTWINSFKSRVIEERELKLCKESHGKMTKNLLSKYQERVAEIEAIVLQTQLSIAALVNNIDNQSFNTAKEIQKFNQLLEINYNQKNLKSIFKSMLSIADLLKYARHIEIERDPLEVDAALAASINEGFVLYEDFNPVNALQKSNSHSELNSTEPYTSDSSSESDSDSQPSNHSEDRDSDIEITDSMSQPISPNRPRSKHTNPPLVRGLSLDSANSGSIHNNSTEISPNRPRSNQTTSPPLVRNHSVDEYASKQTNNSQSKSQQVIVTSDMLEDTKAKLNALLEKIAYRTSSKHYLGLKQLKSQVETLATTVELKAYCETQRRHWELHFAKIAPLQPFSTRKAS